MADFNTWSYANLVKFAEEANAELGRKERTIRALHAAIHTLHEIALSLRDSDLLQQKIAFRGTINGGKTV